MMILASVKFYVANRVKRISINILTVKNVNQVRDRKELFIFGFPLYPPLILSIQISQYIIMIPNYIIIKT